MKSIRIVYWLQIRYIPHLPPQLWVCLMLQQWQRMWIPAKPELQNSSQRLFAMEKEMSHHFLAQSCCCDHWAMAVSCKHHFWADSFAQTLLQEKLLEACSHGAGARLHPKLQNYEWHLPHLQNECWVLHQCAVERFFTVILSEEFFSKDYVGMWQPQHS